MKKINTNFHILLILTLAFMIYFFSPNEFIFAGDINSASKKIKYNIPTGKIPMYFVFGDPDISYGMIRVKGLGKVYPWYKFDLWAKKQGLRVSRDNPPFVNNLLRIFKKKKIIIELDKLNPNKSYFLWLDMAYLRQYSNLLNVDNVLSIYLNGKKIGTIQIPHDQKLNSPYRIPLNEVFLSQGRVSITLETKEGKSNYWAIYDLFLTTDGGNLKNVYKLIVNE